MNLKKITADDCVRLSKAITHQQLVAIVMSYYTQKAYKARDNNDTVEFKRIISVGKVVIDCMKDNPI